MRIGDMTVDQLVEFCDKRLTEDGPGCDGCPFDKDDFCMWHGLEDVVNKEVDFKRVEIVKSHITNAWDEFKEQRVLGGEIYKTFCEKCSQFKDKIIDWKAVGPTSIQITLATKEVFMYDSFGDQLLYLGPLK